MLTPDPIYAVKTNTAPFSVAGLVIAVLQIATQKLTNEQQIYIFLR